MSSRGDRPFHHRGSGKAPAKPAESGFRARRLSTTTKDPKKPDATDMSGMKDALPGSESSPLPGRRGRRMSMSPEMGVVKPRASLPFEPVNVGTYSCHGVEPGHNVGETNAKINQDRGCIISPLQPDQPSETLVMALFCVYDGHGQFGDKVSEFVAQLVVTKVEAHPALCSDPAKALIDAFDSVDADLLKNQSIDAQLSGTTAVVSLFVYDAATDKTTIFTANAGDSRSVLAQQTPKGVKAVDLSEDQKPDTPAEMARIRKAGGYVSPPEEEWGGPARVWMDDRMQLPGLAMGRSIGDHLVKSVGVIATPEVKQHVIGPNDLYVVMASDGVWEFIESQIAINIVEKFMEKGATDACTKLIETAAAKWRQEEGDYRDDITAVCLKVSEVVADLKAQAK